MQKLVPVPKPEKDFLTQALRKRLMIERVSRGWTMEEVAASLGVVGSTISFWESGRSAIPTHQLVRWAALFGLAVVLAPYEPQQ